MLISPDILAVSMTDWTEIRAEFSAKARGENAPQTEEKRIRSFQKDLIS